MAIDQLPIVRQGREVSHLAVQYSPPRLRETSPLPPPPAEAGDPAPPPGLAAAAASPGLCFLYLHGLGSDQDGEKADFFRRRAQAGGFAFCSFDFEGHGRSGGDTRGL